jgi:aminoglycoside/choline kinase family phosphotransferase
VSPALEAAMLDRYRSHAPLDDAAYALLGAQRNAKILGIFTRLWKRDGKPRYLAFQPRVWAYLERDLAHPALAPVTRWFDANVPPAARAAAWEQIPE